MVSTFRFLYFHPRFLLDVTECSALKKTLWSLCKLHSHTLDTVMAAVLNRLSLILNAFSQRRPLPKGDFTHFN